VWLTKKFHFHQKLSFSEGFHLKFAVVMFILNFKPHKISKNVLWKKNFNVFSQYWYEQIYIPMYPTTNTCNVCPDDLGNAWFNGQCHSKSCRGWWEKTIDTKIIEIGDNKKFSFFVPLLFYSRVKSRSAARNRERVSARPPILMNSYI
jgi:hypothetical protein